MKKKSFTFSPYKFKLNIQLTQKVIIELMKNTKSKQCDDSQIFIYIPGFGSRVVCGINFERWRWTLKPLRTFIMVHRVPSVVELEAKIHEVVGLVKSGEQARGSFLCMILQYCVTSLYIHSIDSLQRFIALLRSVNSTPSRPHVIFCDIG